MSVWSMAWALALGLNLAVLLCLVELALLGMLAGFLQAAQRGRELNQQLATPRAGTDRSARPLRPVSTAGSERPRA